MWGWARMRLRCTTLAFLPLAGAAPRACFWPHLDNAIPLNALQAYCTMADSTGCLACLETRELIALLDLQARAGWLAG